MLGSGAYIPPMADKPAPKADDSYSEEETDRRMDATIRAMIGMRPKPRGPKTKVQKSPKRPRKGPVRARGPKSDP